MGKSQEREKRKRKDNFSREERGGLGLRALGSGSEEKGHLPYHTTGRNPERELWKEVG